MAVVAPWLAEDLGLIRGTMSQIDGGVAFHTPQLAAMGPFLRDIGLVLYTLGILGASAAIGNAMVQRDRGSRRTLYLQAWQLRQLVPA